MLQKIITLLRVMCIATGEEPGDVTDDGMDPAAKTRGAEAT